MPDCLKNLAKWFLARIEAAKRWFVYPVAQPDEYLEARRITNQILLVLFLGLIFAGVACEKYWPRAILWSLACIAAGFFGGFLFGIPKVIQPPGSPQEKSRYSQRVNTNLEEISDWLCKIIVGLGLYQLSKIPAWISTLATLFAASVQKEHRESGVFGAIIVFFFFVGFLLGYLFTRLHLQAAFGRADRAVEPDEGDQADAPKKKATDEPDTAPAATPPTPALAPENSTSAEAHQGAINDAQHPLAALPPADPEQPSTGDQNDQTAL